MMLSVIIINYQSAQYTNQCVESIFTSTSNLEFEVILVDNSDQMTELSVILQKYPELRYIKTERNLGFAGGNNVGIAQAKGEFILLLNNDTVVNDQSIVIPLKQLSNHKKLGAITCQLRYPDGKVQHNCQSFPSTVKSFVERSRMHKLLSKSKRSSLLQGFYFDYTKPGYPDWIWGTYFMFRKALLSEFPDKQLNQDYFMYLEDMQWCWDIRKLGYEIAYTPESYIVHFGGGSGADIHYWLKESHKIFQKNTGKYGFKR